MIAHTIQIEIDNNDGIGGYRQWTLNTLKKCGADKVVCILMDIHSLCDFNKEYYAKERLTPEGAKHFESYMKEMRGMPQTPICASRGLIKGYAVVLVSE